MAKPHADEQHLEEQAISIANDIFNLLNEFTNDSDTAKFFLTDDIATACYKLSAGFASGVYEPELNPDETLDSVCLSFMYALMTYGFNIYRKERSLRTNAAPYVMPYDPKVIRRAQAKTMRQTAKGDLHSTPLADTIIMIILDNIDQQMTLEEFEIDGYRLQEEKLLDYTKLSLYWGYNFARELLDPKPRKGRVKKKLE